jgi:predicted amidohydrolase YtcJ
VVADLIFRNGTIFTADPSRPWASTVAVKGGLIVEAAAAREVIDLGGRFLCPGFIDAHVHPITGGLKLLRCNLDHCDGVKSALEAVANYARTHPNFPWIFGGGWWLEWFEGGTPAADLLDRVVPGRPLFLYNRDGHGAWVNTMAMRLAGIDASTPDPPDGRIERNPDGSPQGTLHEGAMALVERLLPAVSSAEWEQATLAGQQHLLSYGITGWQDADVRPEQHAAYLAVAGRGQLVGDVRGALWWERDGDIAQIDRLIDQRQQSVPGYRANSVKLMLDGIAENHSAAMLEPYLEVGGSGIDFIARQALLGIVTALDRHGFQCHFHAIGDRAVRHALDAVEVAKKTNGVNDLRHHISHIQLVHPEDLGRFAALGVVANAQALWACRDPQMIDLTLPFIGAERADRQYPFRSILQAGARLAMGSDWSVSTPDVMQQVEVAVRRVHPEDRSSPPLGPEERLTVGEAIAAFTSGSAYVNHVEDYAGAIVAGHRADLVVLDRNPFDGDPGASKVDMTIVNGEVVFES